MQNVIPLRLLHVRSAAVNLMDRHVQPTADGPDMLDETASKYIPGTYTTWPKAPFKKQKQVTKVNKKCKYLEQTHKKMKRKSVSPSPNEGTVLQLPPMNSQTYANRSPNTPTP